MRNISFWPSQKRKAKENVVWLLKAALKADLATHSHTQRETHTHMLRLGNFPC